MAASCLIHCVELRKLPRIFRELFFSVPIFFRIFEFFGIKINDNFVIIHGNYSQDSSSRSKSCSQAQRLFYSLKLIKLKQVVELTFFTNTKGTKETKFFSLKLIKLKQVIELTPM